MPKALTESNSYAASLQVPLPGEGANADDLEALFFQPAANRFNYVKGLLDTAVADVAKLKTYAQYRLSGSSISPGNKFALALWAASGAFALSSNSVEVPVAGFYLIEVGATAILDSSADFAIGLYIGGSKATGRRLTGPGSGTVYRPYVLSHIATIGTPASQAIDVRVVETTQSLHSDPGLGEHCTLTIRRLF